MYSRIFELSNDRQIAGRRKIKLILHEIFSDNASWQDNGISWNEKYTLQNIESVTNMSLCVGFINDERKLPYGHGLTEIRDNMPYLENATVVGHCEKGYITEIQIDGVSKKVLMAEGYIDEMRYPKFVKWLSDKIKSNGVKGSVEIVGRPENDNRIIYDGGWKEKGRVPQIYDYSGYAILGIKPADNAAIIMELNNNTHKEEINMDEKLMSQFVELIKNAVVKAIAESTNRDNEHKTQIEALNNSIEGKTQEIAALNEKLDAANADVAKKDKLINAQTEELKSLKETNACLTKEKKVSDLNAQLSKFTQEERDLAKNEIEAFKKDPACMDVESIINKICVELVNKGKQESRTHEMNNSFDIFAAMNPTSNKEIDIYG